MYLKVFMGQFEIKGINLFYSCKSFERYDMFSFTFNFIDLMISKFKHVFPFLSFV